MPFTRSVSCSSGCFAGAEASRPVPPPSASDATASRRRWTRSRSASRRAKARVAAVAGALLVFADADLRAFDGTQEVRTPPSRPRYRARDRRRRPRAGRSARSSRRPGESVHQQTLALTDAVLLSGNLESRRSCRRSLSMGDSARERRGEAPASRGMNRRSTLSAGRPLPARRSKSSIHSDMGRPGVLGLRVEATATEGAAGSASAG